MTMSVSDRFDDAVYRLQVARLNIHGRFVRLGAALDTILRQHDYPRPVSDLLGQLVAVTAALSATMKFKGAFTVQTSGDGPVHTLVSDITSEGAIRGYAGFDRDRLQAMAGGEAAGWRKSALIGAGHLALTVDQGSGTDRYQGIVALTDGDLGDDIATYFRDSEQMPAVLRAAVRHGDAGWRAGCLLVHRYPRPDIDLEEEENEENWRYARAVAESLQDSELTGNRAVPAKVLYNLYGSFDATMAGPDRVQFGCRCSRQRAQDMLMRMPAEAMREMIVDGSLYVVCGFCSRRYDFDPDGPELRRH